MLVFFRASAPQLLEDMLEEVKHVTHLRRHHLHVLLTPLLKNWSSHGIGDIFIAFRLLAVRCKVNMHGGPYFVCALLSSFCRHVQLLLEFGLERRVCVSCGRCHSSVRTHA
jgi:hypothetical protein